MKKAVVSGLGLALATVGAAAATEQPRYTVVDHVGAVEIRHYGPRIAAEVSVTGPEMQARNDGFRKVAAFIFGGNTTRTSVAMTAPVVQSGGARSQSIAMTAPVVQTPDGAGQWRIQFIMPAQYTLETLPRPNDPDVHIVVVPAQDYAVLRFTGWRDGPAVSRRTLELTGALAGGGWKVAGAPLAWFYDPPWTLPFLRRNEVAVPVTRNP
jgi:hypothetical protein